jgi:isoquinoline 1-oxidoreductase alpha subunit
MVTPAARRAQKIVAGRRQQEADRETSRPKRHGIGHGMQLHRIEAEIEPEIEPEIESETKSRWRTAALGANIFASFPFPGLRTMSKYTLHINGKAHTLDLAPDTPLLWALRDTLGLVGTKYGCGIGQCGACTVHVDGVPTRSCITPAAALSGKKITTIEGLDAHASHPLQQAWVELDVPQCGYCQAGQIMTAAALLKEHPQPDDQQIDDAMGGNLCRCATYIRIRAGIHRAAALASNKKGAK